MVYYEAFTPKKYRQNAQSTSSLPTLARLPEELLLGTVEYLDNDSIINLRRADKNSVGICNEILSLRFSTLYIHPSTSSLKQAAAICDHELFNKRITNVVILGQVPWREVEACHPHVRQSDCTKSLTVSSLKGRFCPWPHQPYLEKVASPCVDPHLALPLAENYAPLLEGLSKLPKLQKLSFAQKVEARGWNETRQEEIKEHVKRCSAPPKTDVQRMRYADVDVVFSVLGAMGMNASLLRLDTELPFSQSTVSALRKHCTSPCETPKFLSTGFATVNNLTTLDLTLHIGVLSNDHWLERGLVACAAPVLQHLKLTLIPQHARAQAAETFHDLTVLSISDVLSFGGGAGAGSRGMECYFPHLQTLALSYQDPPTPAKYKNRHRRVRPSSQALDLSALLQATRNTIRRVKIDNIIFPPHEHGTYLGNPKDTHLRIHSAVIAEEGTAFPSLESFEWRVNRFNHDPRCRSVGEAPDHGDCDKFLCGWYLRGCTLEHYEGVAETLDAVWVGELRNVYGSWDFGAAVMKARADAVAEAKEREEVVRGSK